MYINVIDIEAAIKALDSEDCVVWTQEDDDTMASLGELEIELAETQPHTHQEWWEFLFDDEGE